MCNKFPRHSGANEGHLKSGSGVAQIAFSGLREGAKVDEGQANLINLAIGESALTGLPDPLVAIIIATFCNTAQTK